MSNPRKSDRRAFQPSLDEKLETRVLLAKPAYSLPSYPVIHVQTGFAGQIARVILQNGEGFEVVVNRGTVRAIPNNKTGIVDLVVKGTTEDTELSINPITPLLRKGLAHKLAPNQQSRTGVMQVGNITITSGTIGSIVGYNTAVLNGAVSIPSLNRVDRLAFQSLAPGASITTGGDINDFDVRQGINLSGANSFIHVGRDINWFNMPNNFVLSNGANFTVGRYVGLAAQPARGTGPAGQGISIGGNLNIDPTSSFIVNGSLQGNVTVQGMGTGISRITVKQAGPGNFYFLNGFTA